MDKKPNSSSFEDTVRKIPKIGGNKFVLLILHQQVNQLWCVITLILEANDKNIRQPEIVNMIF